MTATQSATRTATRTSTATYTSTRTRTATPTPSPSYTNSPTATATSTITFTMTATATPIPEPFQVTLTLYNSAGEVVKKFYTGSSQVAPSGLSIGFLPATNNSIPISVVINGIASTMAPPPMIWNGDNDSGQPIDNGMYYFKMDTTDQFGNMSSYTKDVTVMGNTGGNSLAIYNGAGELVKTIPLDSYPSDLTDFSFTGQQGASGGAMVGGFDPVTGQPQGQLKMDLTDSSGGKHAFTWNGTSDSGQPVSSGVYTVKLVKVQLGLKKIVKAKSITVINAPGSPAQASAASAVVGPNPLMGPAAQGPNAALVVNYKPSAQGSGVVRLYNLAGELVAQGADYGQTGRFTIHVGFVSGGIYLVEFEIRDGGAVLARRAIKVVIIR